MNSWNKCVRIIKISIKRKHSLFLLRHNTTAFNASWKWLFDHKLIFFNVEQNHSHHKNIFAVKTMHCDIDRLLCAFLNCGFVFQLENSDYFRMNSSSCLLRNIRFVKNTRFRIGAMSRNVIIKFKASQYQLHTLQDVNLCSTNNALILA